MARSVTPTTTLVAAGTRGRVLAVDCTAGKDDAPYPEVHDAYTIALVRHGTFDYRSNAANGRHTLREGWLVLGTPGTTFECSHAHDGGDVCTSVQIEAAVVDEVASTLGLPPFEGTVRGPLTRAAALLARLPVADADETLYDLVAAVVGAGAAPRLAAVEDTRIANRRRIEAAVALIEAASHEKLSLDALAAEAGLSAYYFLRLFRAMTGTTPHQYVVGARLRHAARLLVDTALPVTRIALDVGFDDVSNFVRTFHRAVGASPRAYRRRPRASFGSRRGPSR